MNDMVFDRIKGALVGVAVGDALGGPLEFMGAEQIKKRHGRVKDMIGGGWLGLEPGEVTDDTQMTMCVARGIAENPNDPIPGIGRRFMAWYMSGPKDVGGTCAAAIRQAMRIKADSEGAWLASGLYVKGISNRMNAGNGALMRTIYPAIFYADPKVRAEKVRNIGRMTHYNEISDEICVRYSDAVHKAIFGGHPSYTVVKDNMYKKNAGPTGYVLDSWSNALDSIDKTDSFEEAVIEAVNRGGDADTIGAIAGGLAGAYYGFSNIPKRWLDKLDAELLIEMEYLAELAYQENKRYYSQNKKPSQEGSVNRLWISDKPVHKGSMNMAKRLFATAILLLFCTFVAMTAYHFKEKPEETTTEQPKPTIIEQPQEAPDVSEETEEDPTIYLRYPLTDKERDIVERVVMTESGDQPLLGQMAVAECILNTAEATNQRPDAVVMAPNQYAAPSSYASDSVKQAVELIFDTGESATGQPIRYFYAPKYSAGRWHESALEYVVTIGDHKFFKIKE